MSESNPDHSVRAVAFCPTDEQLEPMIERAAAALDEQWPRLGILSRAVVYRHPTKAEIAEVALRAALTDQVPHE